MNYDYVVSDVADGTPWLTRWRLVHLHHQLHLQLRAHQVTLTCVRTTNVLLDQEESPQTCARWFVVALRSSDSTFDLLTMEVSMAYVDFFFVVFFFVRTSVVE